MKSESTKLILLINKIHLHWNYLINTFYEINIFYTEMLEKLSNTIRLYETKTASGWPKNLNEPQNHSLN